MFAESIPSDLVKLLIAKDIRVLILSPVLVDQYCAKHAEDFNVNTILSRIILTNENNNRSYFVITILDTLVYDTLFEKMLKYFFRTILGEATFLINNLEDARHFQDYRVTNSLKPANILVSDDNIFISCSGIYNRFIISFVIIFFILLRVKFNEETDLSIGFEKNDETSLFSVARSIVLPVYDSQNNLKENLQVINQQIEDFKDEISCSSQEFYELESFLTNKQKELNDEIKTLSEKILVQNSVDENAPSAKKQRTI